jgi:hypothetical protein
MLDWAGLLLTLEAWVEVLTPQLMRLLEVFPVVGVAEV